MEVLNDYEDQTIQIPGTELELKDIKENLQNEISSKSQSIKVVDGYNDLKVKVKEVHEDLKFVMLDLKPRIDDDPLTKSESIQDEADNDDDERDVLEIEKTNRR